MRLILLSDLHLTPETPVARLDDVAGDTQWGKLRFIFNYARKYKIGHVLQAGDFTDVTKSWELMQRLSEFLSEYQEIKIYAVRGQHDSYYRDMNNRRTIMGVLDSLITAKHVPSSGTYLNDGVRVFGCDYEAHLPIMRPIINDVNILVIHRQILIKKFWKVQEGYEYAPDFLKANKQYDLILCGDAHQRFIHQEGKRIICNTGPLLRLEASENMFEHKPCFYIYDTASKKLETIEIPHAPASSILSREHLVTASARKESFANFVAQVKDASQTKSCKFERNLKLMTVRLKASEQVKKYIAEVEERADEKL